MKPLFIPLLFLALSCATASPGLSFRTAWVINRSDSTYGVNVEHGIIKKFYDGYKIIGKKRYRYGRSYYDTYILRDDRSQLVVYFDVTNYFKK